MNSTAPTTTVTKSEKEESPCACNLHVFNQVEKQRHSELMRKLDEATLETAELEDGYGFKLRVNVVTVTDVAEWITYERLCCPFFSFEIELQPENRALWLRLRGGTKVKEFLRPDVERHAVFEPKF